jgi:hypothetical protein
MQKNFGAEGAQRRTQKEKVVAYLRRYFIIVACGDWEKRDILIICETHSDDLCSQ